MFIRETLKCPKQPRLGFFCLTHDYGLWGLRTNITTRLNTSLWAQRKTLRIHIPKIKYYQSRKFKKKNIFLLALNKIVLAYKHLFFQSKNKNIKKNLHIHWAVWLEQTGKHYAWYLYLNNLTCGLTRWTIIQYWGWTLIC